MKEDQTDVLFKTRLGSIWSNPDICQLYQFEFKPEKILGTSLRKPHFFADFLPEKPMMIRWK